MAPCLQHANPWVTPLFHLPQKNMRLKLTSCNATPKTKIHSQHEPWHFKSVCCCCQFVVYTLRTLLYYLPRTWWVSRLVVLWLLMDSRSVPIWPLSLEEDFYYLDWYFDDPDCPLGLDYHFSSPYCSGWETTLVLADRSSKGLNGEVRKKVEAYGEGFLGPFGYTK